MVVDRPGSSVEHATRRRVDLVVVHLYPDLLMSYGDRGNVLTVVRRAEWRGFRVAVTGVTRGDPLPRRADIILIGGGSDRLQHLVGRDLLARREELRECVQAGTVIFGVCGGYQLLGHRYLGSDGREVSGLGLLDMTTTAVAPRMVGRVTARANIDGTSFDLTGFENHGGRTFLGPSASPLGSVPIGQGNNGRDGTEGAVRDGVVGTYLHGPVLPTAPAFADALLVRALRRVNGGAPLDRLDDRIEVLAASSARGRRR
jgi:lipid II isoglutaminyl synthase (glutamine-hydrolysing)